MLIAIAFLVALFFAMNIGGSGAAASMGIAYGSGAVKHKYLAVPSVHWEYFSVQRLEVKK